MKNNCSVVIIGAGPAGLTATHELVKQGIQAIVLEQADRVGGISRTETYKGYRFDIGGHRFYTEVGEIQQIWVEILGNNFLKVPRLSRIYYNGKFFNYPLEVTNALSNLGIINSLLMLFSYLQVKIKPDPVEENFEQWVCNRFGKKLYATFFKSYTEKVWGISCTEIRADWAAQRIQGMSLKRAILNSLFKNNQTKSLIKEFYYPEFGPGMMWEKCQEIVTSKGGKVHLNTTVDKIYHQDHQIQKITVRQENQTFDLQADQFISSMPVTALILRLDPPAPTAVLEAARSLKYRDFLIVALIIDEVDLFPDNWIYIHSPEFKVGRIQNFKNWSPAMVPDSSKTCLGMEYFCNKGDELWLMSDSELIEIASKEIVDLSLLLNIKKIEDATVIRQLKAYPVYDENYRQHLQVIQDYLQDFDNLQTIGRNGMHRYNNQDHSMLTGLLAAKNILGENHNLWDVNTERSYYEEFTKKDGSTAL
ncbi:MAG: NAD(P)/FAD-dependent oxidoreductase [Dolichospermum sp. DEX189]|nr:NAD(P)/FAD-dependent oxidoreductase [Dolichospermum sp. DEX189]